MGNRKRVRLVRVVIQPELVVEEAGELAPLGVQPIPLSALEWRRFGPAQLDELLRDAEARLNTDTDPGKGVAPPARAGKHGQ